MLYKVVLSLKSVDETQVCDHSNDSYQAVLSCCAVYFAVSENKLVLMLTAVIILP